MFFGYLVPNKHLVVAHHSCCLQNMSAVKLFSDCLVINILAVCGLCADTAGLIPHKLCESFALLGLMQCKETVQFNNSYCTYMVQRIWELYLSAL